MLLYFVFRVISATAAFLYPGYASYKTLSQRPASEEDLEKWLMYWSVVGCIVSVEYVAEWLVSWLPLYYPMKTLFLLYLALPQTAGASYIYTVHLQPFFAAHEAQIDSALSQLKTYLYTYLQGLLRSAWSHVSATLGQPQSEPSQSGITREAGANTGAPPTLNDPISGPAQIAQSLWRSYGPSIIASGAAMLHQAQASAATPPAPTAMDSNPPSRMASTSNVHGYTQASPYDVSSYDASPGASPVLVPSTAPMMATSRNSSSSSVRERTNSGKNTFEEVEVPSDIEPDTIGGHEGHARPEGARRSSWFAWGAQGKGYEKVKSD